MMDRVQFFQSIQTTENRCGTFVRYFDQLMGLYGLIPDTDVRISTYPTNDKMLIVKLVFSDPNRSMEIRNRLLTLGNTITIYEHTFPIGLMESLNELEINVRVGL